MVRQRNIYAPKRLYFSFWMSLFNAFPWSNFPMQKYLTGGQDVTECPLAGDEFQKLFKASTVLTLWSSFQLVFCPGSAGVLAVTFLSIYKANTNNKPAHNTHHRGLLMWQSGVSSFSCFPPQHDFRLLIDIKITFLLLHFIYLYSKYIFFFFPPGKTLLF